MNLSHILTVYAKELRDALRDKRTLFSTLVIPTFGIPLIMGVVAFISSNAVKKTQQELPAIMIVGAADSPLIRKALEDFKDVRVVPTEDDWARQISEKKIRAAVELPADFDARLARGEETTVNLRHYQGEMASGFAVGALQRFFSSHREKIVAERLKARDVPTQVIEPFKVETTNVAPPEKVGGNMLGGLLPYLALVACFGGAMHPAIDLTAGEKERGTLETILSSPLARIDLVLGKFLLVLTTALATVICSLTSMTASLFIGATIFGPKAPPAETVANQAAEVAPQAAGAVAATLHMGGVVGCLALVLPIAVLASAAMLALGVAAKSIKEAQSYLAPLMFVIIVPAMISLLPGIDLTLPLALIPVLNVSLTAKQMVSGVFNWPLIAVTFLSCWVYAGLALAFCARQFNRESVLFRF